MNSEINFKPYLDIWKDMSIERMKNGDPNDSHLSDETLYQMVTDGGMKNADPNIVKHLARCPLCMRNWASWREAISMSEKVENDEGFEETPAPDMTYCTITLKAAASETTPVPISGLSACGRFRLGILPEINRPGNFLFKLDVLNKEDRSFEKKRVTVYSPNNGQILLNDIILEGRAAGRFKHPAKLDLKTLTIVIE